MTMIEKPLIIVIFVYAVSFGILGAQFVLGDVFNVTLTNFEGVEIRSNLLDVINVDALNTRTSNVVGTNQTTITENPITAAAEIALEVFLILTGTYIFNVLLLLGVPAILIAGMVILYVIMLSRTIIAYLRGI